MIHKSYNCVYNICIYICKTTFSVEPSRPSNIQFWPFVTYVVCVYSDDTTLHAGWGDQFSYVHRPTHIRRPEPSCARVCPRDRRLLHHHWSYYRLVGNPPSHYTLQNFNIFHLFKLSFFKSLCWNKLITYIQFILFLQSNEISVILINLKCTIRLCGTSVLDEIE